MEATRLLEGRYVIQRLLHASVRMDGFQLSRTSSAFMLITG